MAAILALGALWLNPFQSFTRYISEDLYMRSIAAAYPSALRPRTLLVLADDGVLEAAEKGRVDARWSRWPLPLSAWGAALDQAQARGAAFVLVDVGLIDRREPADERELLDTLKLVAETSDVFLVDPGSYPMGETLSAWLVRNARTPRVHLVSPERAPVTGLATTYLDKPGRLSSPMAAVAMAHAYCGSHRGRCAIGSPRSDRFVLWWPLPGCMPIAGGPGPCRAGVSSALARAGRLLLAQALSGICENLPRLSPCSGLPPSAEPGFAVDEMPFERFVAGRATSSGITPDAVVIGQDFDMAQDVVRSPVYGMTPGAHAHAVAFDNLVTLGRGAVTRSYPGGMGENVFLSLWIVGVLVSGHLVRSVYRRFSASKSKEPRQHGVRLLRRIEVDRLLPVAFTAAMLLTFLLYCFERSISPANWIAAYAALGIGWAEESRTERYARLALVRAARRRPSRGLVRRLVAVLVRRR